MNTRKPNRLKEFDYSQSGYYFVTICTKNRVEYFGEIQKEQMTLNQFGEIAKRFWFEIPDHFENLKIDESIILPNHVHGILIISGDSIVGDANLRPLRYDRSKMLLSKAMQGYEAAVTREINKLQNKVVFKWQRSFYDHIIRNDEGLYKIRKYIRYNPLKWEYDQENKNEIPFEQKKKFWKDFLKSK